LAGAGWGADLSDRALGETAGAETHTLTTDEMPLHGHAYRASLTSQSSASCHTSGGFMHNTGGQSNRGPYTSSPSSSVGIGGTGGGQAHSIMRPVAFVNFMAKL
jgi:microcystin-dependent protein